MDIKKEIKISEQPALELADLSDIVRGWLQALQLDALSSFEEST